MKVYVLERADYEESEILGVFDSLTKAKVFKGEDLIWVNKQHGKIWLARTATKIWKYDLEITMWEVT